METKKALNIVKALSFKASETSRIKNLKVKYDCIKNKSLRMESY